MRAAVVDAGHRPLHNLNAIPNGLMGWNPTRVARTMTSGGAPGGRGYGSLRVNTVGYWPRIDLASSTARARFPVLQPGEWVTMLFWARSPQAASARIGGSWRDMAGGEFDRIGVNHPIGTDWTLVRYHRQADRTFPAYFEGWLGMPDNTPLDTVLDITLPMLVVGRSPYLGEYADGATPGWRWTGAESGSESVGYPYTLESIAGRPLASAYGAETTALDGVTSTGALTLYHVSDKLTAGGAWQDTSGVNVQSSGIAHGSGMVVGYAGGGNASTQMRVDTAPSSSGFNQFSGPQAAPVGRHLQIAQVSEGITRRRHTIDRAAWTSDLPAVANSGIRRVFLRGNPDSTAYRHIVSHLYAAEHDEATRAAVMRWLGNRHGIPFA